MNQTTIFKIFLIFSLFFLFIERELFPIQSDIIISPYSYKIEIDDPKSSLSAAEFFIDPIKQDGFYCSIKCDDKIYIEKGTSPIEAYYKTVFLYLTHPKIPNNNFDSELKRRLKILEEKRNKTNGQKIYEFLFNDHERAYQCLILDNCDGATTEKNYKAFFKLYSEQYPEMLVAKTIYLDAIRNNPNRPEYFDENGNLIESKLPLSIKAIVTASAIESLLTFAGPAFVRFIEARVNKADVIDLRYQGEENGVPYYSIDEYKSLPVSTVKMQQSQEPKSITNAKTGIPVETLQSFLTSKIPAIANNLQPVHIGTSILMKDKYGWDTAYGGVAGDAPLTINTIENTFAEFMKRIGGTYTNVSEIWEEILTANSISPPNKINSVFELLQILIQILEIISLIRILKLNIFIENIQMLLLKSSPLLVIF